MSKRVLIVDDEPAERVLLQLLFRDYDVEVLQAENGLRGVEVAYAECPDLIIVDNRMPIVSGIEAAKRIREDGELKEVPIILFSAGEFDPGMKELYELRPIEVLLKPSGHDELLQAVKFALGELPRKMSLSYSI